MKTLFKKVVLFIIFGLLLSACSTQKVSIPVERAAEIDLGGIRNIAVRNFQGEHGRDISELLTQELISSGEFEVIDRQHVDQLINEYNLADMDGLIDRESAVELGNLIGVAALVYGRVAVHNYDEEPILSNQKKNIITGEEYIENIRRGRARVEVAFNVLNLETGQILSSKRIGTSIPHETSSRGANSYPPEIDIASLMSLTRNAVVQEFMKSIATHEETIPVRLLTDDDIPEFDTAIALIKIQEWYEALEIFEQVAEEYPENPKALYNLGIAYKYTNQFEEAEKYLKEAYMMNHDDDIATEINHLREMARDAESSYNYDMQVEEISESDTTDNQTEETNSSDPIDILWVQRKLNELGYNCGVADGIMGPNTRGCIEAYQEANDLRITGSIDSETTEALNDLK